MCFSSSASHGKPPGCMDRIGCAISICSLMQAQPVHLFSHGTVAPRIGLGSAPTIWRRRSVTTEAAPTTSISGFRTPGRRRRRQTWHSTGIIGIGQRTIRARQGDMFAHLGAAPWRGARPAPLRGSRSEGFPKCRYVFLSRRLPGGRLSAVPCLPLESSTTDRFLTTSIPGPGEPPPHVPAGEI